MYERREKHAFTVINRFITLTVTIAGNKNQRTAIFSKTATT